MKIIGVNFYSGEYEGKAYKGYKIHYTSKFDETKGVGSACYNAKVPVDVFNSIMMEVADLKKKEVADVKDLIGLEFKAFYYTQFGKVTGIAWS